MRDPSPYRFAGELSQAEAELVANAVSAAKDYLAKLPPFSGQETTFLEVAKSIDRYVKKFGKSTISEKEWNELSRDEIKR